jgi:sterol desaturase/sphingolipid hydroxylase (fatty acid hydroxylase superfamily)
MLEALGAVFDLRGFLIVALIFMPLERVFALRKGQSVFRSRWRNDLVYHLLNPVVVKGGLLVLTVVALALSQFVVPRPLRVWIGLQPLWLQAVVVTVVADLGFYLVHRLFHGVPGLWKFHAVHHSIEEMDWLAAARVHPIDQILTKGTGLMAVFALGFSAEAIAVHAAVYSIQSFFVHANLKFRGGPLRWLMATPEFHHWHHANEPQAHNRNYAGQIPLWDLLFGTLHMPPNRMPSRYGVDEPVPATYFAQLAYPFRGLGLAEFAGNAASESAAKGPRLQLRNGALGHRGSRCVGAPGQTGPKRLRAWSRSCWRVGAARRRPINNA